MKEIDEEIIKKNEYDANIQMIYACVFSSVVLFLIWIGYLTKLFPLRSYTLVHIFIPISVLILASTILFKKNKKIVERPRFKFFLVMMFMLVVSILNIIIPKHSILAWAICILLSNHFYNSRFSTKIFVSSLIMMLICIYLGMFIGEYDPNLLTSGRIVYDESIGNYYLYQPDTIKDRIAFVNERLQEGENRYLKVFLYYYLSRAFILTIIYFVSQALNKRTFKLLKEQSESTTFKERIETELSVAKNIQFSNLPSETYRGKLFSIIAEVIPAKEVGGDLYDYFILDDDHVGFVIGDVSGKGTPAAMFMMKTITCFKNSISLNKTPSEVLKEVNRVLYDGNESTMFVTCFLGILNTKTRELVYSNAGHNAPIVGHNKNFKYLKTHSGFLLGGLPEVPVSDEKIVLEKGDLILLYTDGITEARNNDKDFYGEERFINFLNSKEFASIIELEHELKDDINLFSGGAEQSDDMTYLILEYSGEEIYFEEYNKTSKPDDVKEIIEKAKLFLKKHNLEKESSNMLVVIDEIASNISKYAYDNADGLLFFRIMYNKTKEELVCTFIDRGKPFNQLEVNNSIVDESTTKPGGLGILIVKNMMDEATYSYVNRKNIIKLARKIK